MTTHISPDDPDFQKYFDEAAAILAKREAADPSADVWPFKEGPGFDFDPATMHPGTSYVSIGFGDCMTGMRDIPEGSVHAVVTDPPYGMGIDGKKWDAEVPGAALWKEVLRTLKPGGIAIAASHARTYHRLATAMEDAGFEIIDMFSWQYSKAFPAGKKLDDNGWRSLLRRSHEPWVVARKPLPVVETLTKTGRKSKKKLGIQATFDLHGTAGFWVNGNGLDGKKWAANSVLVEKPLRAERDLGLDAGDVKEGTTRRGKSKSIGGGVAAQANNHSTVKPIALMRRLVRLVAGDGDLVMDPFSGSGTTGMACMAEGMNFIGFEMDHGSYDLLQQRVEHAHRDRASMPAAPADKPKKSKPAKKAK